MSSNKNELTHLLEGIQLILKKKDSTDINKICENFQNDKYICASLKSLNKKLQTNYYSKIKVEHFINKVNTLLLNYARHHYSKKLNITNDEIFDTLVTSINFLGEELNFSTVTTYYLDDVFSSLGDMLLVVDKEGHILYSNLSLWSTVLYKEGELKDKNIKMILEPDVNISNILESKSNQKLTNFISSTGNKIPVSLKISNFSRSDNPMMGYVIVARDMSQFLKHQKEIESKNEKIQKVNTRLRKALHKAKESDELKTAFLANMSHEIRTPLNGIMGFSELLLDPYYSKDELAEFGKIVHGSAKQLLNIVNDVLDISKIKSGTLELNSEKFSVNDILNDLFIIYQQKIKSDKKNIQLILKKTLEDKEAILKSDATRFRQVLTNLLDNAVKFTQNGEISFGYTVTNKKLIFFVEDSGIGIPKEKAKNVFLPFTQVDHSLTRPYGGTGLGLAIASGVAELMNGKITLQSVEGEGSTFYFHLPFTRAKTVIKKISIKDAPSYDWSGKKILVVEDDPAAIKMCNYIISKTGATLFIAENGTNALDYYISHRKDIDLILMDIKLPDFDGCEVTRKIRLTDKEVPIIAHSAHVSMSDKSKCIDAGSTDFISKPIIKDLFLKIINRYLYDQNEQ
ncbi:MAG: ATP-binding protein [Bacteroidales bacterium]|nr:ATP-binding protein [Bacteroidales bacterium]